MLATGNTLMMLAFDLRARLLDLRVLAQVSFLLRWVCRFLLQTYYQGCLIGRPVRGLYIPISVPNYCGESNEPRYKILCPFGCAVTTN